MKEKIKVSLPLALVCLLFQYCRKTGPEELKGVALIWANDYYSAFTDLTRYHDTWYCIFREAENHVGSNGFIRIMSSKDSKIWKSETVLRIDNSDLRDPKFLIDFKDQLCIYAFSTNPNDSQNVLWRANATVN